MYRLYRDLGFGTATGLPYPSEASGVLYEPRRWSKQSHASLAIGYELLITPLQLALAYADLVYNGLWFSPLRQALDAFVDQSQLPVTGDVRIKLYKGVASAVGRRSPFGLYREDLATFGEDDVYRQADAEGFIRLFGLGQKVAAQRDRRLRVKEESLEVAR